MSEEDPGRAHTEAASAPSSSPRRLVRRGFRPLHFVMHISGRHLLMALAAIIVAVGVTLLIRGDAALLAWIIIGCGALSFILLTLYRGFLSGPSTGRAESDDINDINAERTRELVRGTSLYLRELQYRYSIRLDPNQSTEQRPFSAEVNTIKLGFVPVVIIDNTNDRQGYGYVAFVHDGKRWRGPGLPCPAGQVEAVRHAAKCVSPLSKEEETKF